MHQTRFFICIYGKLAAIFIGFFLKTGFLWPLKAYFEIKRLIFHNTVPYRYFCHCI